jgi:hypothetical protein
MKHLPKLGEITFRGEKLGIYKENYKNNGRLTIVVSGQDGAPFATLSCNVVDCDLPDVDCFHVKTWSENAELARAVAEAGIFLDTGLCTPTGRVVAPIWRLKQYIWVVEHGTLSAFRSEEDAQKFIMQNSQAGEMKITKVLLR